MTGEPQVQGTELVQADHASVVEQVVAKLASDQVENAVMPQSAGEVRAIRQIR